MDVVFLVAEKFKSDRKVLDITPEDVKSKKVFNVYDPDAKDYIQGKLAKAAKLEEVKTAEDAPTEPTPLNSLTINELKVVAKEKGIDLGTAKTKPAILEIMEKALAESEESEEDTE